ncbi:hypothetical protein GC105_01440 [Alkalibaculum sp. M08DMB]|uniref:DUF2933 domain-containing protein n=1 Tax=Alkalibaculum sporogenes TaxID=2655001 RepID=A0A6A7K4R9_9FIRM|nr:hypothetical protein [Alkalibaculum sporogenes]MPW24456.1 hypothetical protein [Alkalibaculum sporogenes]
MKYRSDNRENKGESNHSPIKHMFHMVLCCGLPILIIASLPLVARFSTSTSLTLAAIAPFICPLIMIPMIIMMFKGDKKSCCNDKESIKNK